ncbi:helix-turn-helix transcriptional regulator [Filimonas effusa]|uniref:AraC family transcriptional regulator n=1 Tax=Filimonas effusa TaxID=2508721 RepID=A0A4V1MA22_9BACT|nr:AraC family transcriptional regulator [Filimonas effusa]RXK83664.1 AraC family transcriptional regulator [Filimonas effusa]
MSPEEQVNGAVSYVQRHMGEDFTARQVADHSCLSYSRFLHVFAQHRQESFWQYVKRHRLEQAASLVRFSGYNAGEIGERCGYATRSSFSKAFYGHFNCTTRAFQSASFLPHEHQTMSVVHSLSEAASVEPVDLSAAEWIRLPDLMLYYFIPPRLSADEPAFMKSFGSWHARLQPWAIQGGSQFLRMVTGTLDSVPATPYLMLNTYFGVVVPRYDDFLNTLLNNSGSFLSRPLCGGKYLRLPLQHSCRSASPVCYEFVKQNCLSGNFKLRENQFFIALTGESECELYIPVTV